MSNGDGSEFGMEDGRPVLHLGNQRTITIERVNIDLLREQRDTLLCVADHYHFISPFINAEGKGRRADHIDGVINLLDEMLDIAEGFKV